MLVTPSHMAVFFRIWGMKTRPSTCPSTLTYKLGPCCFCIIGSSGPSAVNSAWLWAKKAKIFPLSIHGHVNWERENANRGGKILWRRENSWKYVYISLFEKKFFRLHTNSSLKTRVYRAFQI